jgi:hypothetical protein
VAATPNAVKAADWLVGLSVAAAFIVPSPPKTLPFVMPLFGALGDVMPPLRHLLPSLASILTVVLPPAASMGVWFRSRAAWVVALACTVIGLAASTMLVQDAAPSRPIPALGSLPLTWLWNTEVLGLLIRLTVLGLLFMPLRGWVFARATATEKQGESTGAR